MRRAPQRLHAQPLLPEQAHAGQPSLSLATMVDGTALALAVALRAANDRRHAEGTLD